MSLELGSQTTRQMDIGLSLKKKVDIDRLGNRNGIGEKSGPGNGCHAINAPPAPPLSGLTFTYAFFLTLYLNYGLWTMEYGHTFGHIPFGIISCWAFFIFVITD